MTIVPRSKYIRYINFDFIKIHFNDSAISLLLSVVGIGTHMIWFKLSGALFNGDWSYWTNQATREAWKSQNTWNNFYNLGIPRIQIGITFLESLWSLVIKMGGNFDIATKITIMTPIAIIGFVGPYLALRRLVTNKISCFIGALFYGSTSYFLISQGSHLPIAFIYALTPIIFVFFVKALEELRLTPWLSFALIYTLGLLFEVRIMYIVTLILLIYALVFFPKRSNLPKLCRQLIIVWIVLIGLNSLWLLPTLLGGASASIAETTSRRLFGNSLFNLTHSLALSDSGWTGSRPNENFIIQSVRQYLWVMPLIAVFTLISYKQFSNSKKKLVIYFASVSLLGIFLTKQVDNPFILAYSWLYANFPGFNLFREASKFYLFTAWGYLGLIVIGLAHFAKRHIHFFYLAGAATAIVSIINLSPLVTGHFADLFVNRRMPNDYILLNKFLDSSTNMNTRALWVPSNSQWGYFDSLHPRVSMVSQLQQQDAWLQFNDNPYAPMISQITSFLRKPSAENILNSSSVKYVILPLRDPSNDDDFFAFYGDDRQAYTYVLNNTPWLKKIEIGTKDVTVYENKYYKPYISTFNSLHNLNSLSNLEQVSGLASNQLNNKDFHFQLAIHTSRNDNSISDIFNDLNREDLQPNGLTRGFAVNHTDNQIIFANNNRPVISYKIIGNIITFNAQKLAGPIVQKNNTSLVQDSTRVIGSTTLASDTEYWISAGKNLLWVDKTKSTRQLGVVTDAPELEATGSQNLIPNASLEQGLWQPKVSDCNNYDKIPQINQRLDKNDKTNGLQSLVLEADKHIACTGPDPIKVTPGGKYLLDFSYKAIGGRVAGYEIDYIGSKTPVLQEYLYPQDTNWRNLSTKITIPNDATAIKLIVKGFPDDRQKTHAINFYDDFRLSKLTPILTTKLDTTAQFIQTKINATSDININYESSLKYKNLIENGSLEKGLWQNTVGDCNNFDQNPILGMRISKDYSDGTQSLQLEATRHTACTSPAPAKVSENGKYLLSFDYQSSNADNAGYYVAFNDSSRTVVSEQLPIKDIKWHNFTKTITAPYGSTSLQLAIYSYAGDLGNQKIITRYDNFFLTQVPDISNQYYLVSSPHTTLKQPATVNLGINSPTNKTISIKGATTPFYLAMSEAYHSQWRLEFKNARVKGIQSWLPLIKPNAISDSDHIKLNDFQNGWYVDVHKYCDEQKLCTKNADGSYDMEMLVEFAPQRWFYVGLIISGTTLFACIGYLIISRRSRRRKPTNDPTYKLHRNTTQPKTTPNVKNVSKKHAPSQKLKKLPNVIQ